MKFGRGRDWMRLSGYNIVVALAGKFLPQFLIFTTVFLGYMIYIFGHLDFPTLAACPPSCCSRS